MRPIPSLTFRRCALGRSCCYIIEPMGNLTIVSTPIGNLGDITQRAKEALSVADAIYAEDTRVTMRLLHSLGLDMPRLGVRRLDENVLSAKFDEVAELVRNGASVAFASDAGMPGVADPGLRLAAYARAADLPLTVLPGASAAALAYSMSGTRNDRYAFCGFMPRRQGERAELFGKLAPLDFALVFYESPKRVVQSLEDLAEAFPNREGAVCRELTKLHEEVVRAPLPELASMFKERSESADIKGEIALVVDGPSEEEASGQQSDRLQGATKLMQELSGFDIPAKALAQAASSAFDIPKNVAYDIALELKRK